MKLLILDIDETLIYASEKKLSEEADFTIENYQVYKRPYLKEFLEMCFKTFNVGIWTSSNEGYAEEVISKLLIDKNVLSFLWARKRCTFHYDRELTLPSFVKNLKKVKRLGYCLQQVIVVDDSPEKHTKNYGNLVPVLPFNGQLDDKELVFLSEYLLWLNLQPNIRSVEKRFWRSCF